jgi:von Willebrand factor type A domain
MEIPPHYKNLIKQQKSLLQEFLDDNPNLLPDLSMASREAFYKICSAISHWRSRKANEYFRNIYLHLKSTESNPFRNLIVRGALRLSGLHWAMARPYFTVVNAVPQNEDFIEEWTNLAYFLGKRDVDVAVTFIEQSPGAIETFGEENFFQWGELALETLIAGKKTWKAAKAYLTEAVLDQCATPLSRWEFILAQASRISEVSTSAAKAFIQSGARICLLLNDSETAQWVDDGLEGYEQKKQGKGFGARQLREHDRPEGSKTGEDLINYFSGTSQKALEKRDGIASGVALKDRNNTLSLICEAYLGRKVRIRSNTTLAMHKGFAGGAATDGRTIYLPDMVPEFTMFKLMALHQAILMDFDIWSEECGKKRFDPVKVHTDADEKLLGKLPGLITEMKKLLNGGLPSDYPYKFDKEAFKPLPWWGDILPGLVRETNATIAKLKECAADRTELPPEMIEGLVTNMMADGERDFNDLWSRLTEIFDTEIFSPDPEELEESFKTFFYKEWDENLSDYKMDWCLVRQRFIKDDPNDFVEEVRNRLHGIIGLIRRQFTRLRPERFQKFRAQPYGDALDIDALVQSMVDKRSSSFLDENVYVRRDKRMRDVAVLFLLDMSGSTEEKIQGRRVIDIQKEAMVLMAEALESLGDAYAMYGFSSEGRFRVDFFNIKDFNEPYGEQVRHRLGNVQPIELTRMGAILRHATHKFDGVPAAVKLMVILTDGRPYDYEYGSLNYAIADTKNAIQDARKHNIHPFIITSDKKGASYLRRISPQTQSIVLRKVELLPIMLPAIYKRLTV